MNIIEISNCSFSYATSNSLALDGTSLAIEQGKITLLCGKSGSGKSTLLRLLKKEATPAGTLTGVIRTALSPSEVAIIFQNPDTQLVCTTVLHDLVFHMENLGVDPALMKKRLAETCCFFGIEHLLHKKADELSGGQKQLVALCSSLMVLPKLLLLDEPLSQLDPIAAREFLDTLKRINHEFGITIVVCEHRLNELSLIADNIALLDKGKVIYSGTTTQVVADIWAEHDSRYLPFIPDIPLASLTLLKKVILSPSELSIELPTLNYKFTKDNDSSIEVGVSAKDVVFSYKGSGEYVLRRFTASFHKGKTTCVLGGNGSGKSTLLKLISGIYKDHLGKFKRISKRIAYMPQNVWTYFTHDTVKGEITFADYDETYYSHLMDTLDISHLENRHPFDLSGGEALRVCLASILLKKADIILLDEPTRGLHSEVKQTMITLLKQSGATVIMSSHDLEFVAQHADQCMMLFDGEVAFTDDAHSFFKESNYYTTSICKAFANSAKDVVTIKDVLAL